MASILPKVDKVFPSGYEYFYLKLSWLHLANLLQGKVLSSLAVPCMNFGTNWYFMV